MTDVSSIDYQLGVDGIVTIFIVEVKPEALHILDVLSHIAGPIQVVASPFVFHIGHDHNCESVFI